MSWPYAGGELVGTPSVIFGSPTWLREQVVDQAPPESDLGHGPDHDLDDLDDLWAEWLAVVPSALAGDEGAQEELDSLSVQIYRAEVELTGDAIAWAELRLELHRLFHEGDR